MNNSSIHTQKNLQKNSKIKLRKGNTRQGQHVYIQSPTQFETNKQVYLLFEYFYKINLLKFNYRNILLNVVQILSILIQLHR